MHRSKCRKKESSLGCKGDPPPLLSVRSDANKRFAPNPFSEKKIPLLPAQQHQETKKSLSGAMHFRGMVSFSRIKRPHCLNLDKLGGSQWMLHSPSSSFRVQITFWERRGEGVCNCIAHFIPDVFAETTYQFKKRGGGRLILIRESLLLLLPSHPRKPKQSVLYCAAINCCVQLDPRQLELKDVVVCAAAADTGGHDSPLFFSKLRVCMRPTFF